MSLGVDTKRVLSMANVGVPVSRSSGEKTASALIYTGDCLFTGIKVLTDDINDVTVTIYDNTAASGKIVDKFVIPANDRVGGALYGAAPPAMDNGLYVELSGANSAYYAFYSPIA